MPVDGPVMVVDVPVVEVVMVGPDEPEESGPNMQKPHGHGTNVSCTREMENLIMNRTRVMSSQACENKQGFAKHAIQALQKADLSAALKSIKGTFHDCAAISSECADELAPDVELKMRLSGITIERQCADAAHALAKKHEKGGSCQENVTKSMVSELEKENLEGAMAAAQRGISVCNGIASPCDFQLAPVLVGQLMEAQAEQEERAMLGALLSGLRQAAERSNKLVAKQSKGSLKKRTVKTDEAKHKAVSLIDIAERVRITSEKRAISL